MLTALRHNSYKSEHEKPSVFVANTSKLTSEASCSPFNVRPSTFCLCVVDCKKKKEQVWQIKQRIDNQFNKKIMKEVKDKNILKWVVRIQKSVEKESNNQQLLQWF